MSQQDHYLPPRKRSEFKAAVKRWQAIDQTPGIPQSTRQWMMQSLDPFHDTPLKAVGYPSGVNDQIIVHEVTRRLTITKPPNLASGNWDCHITTNNVAGVTTTEGALGFVPAFNNATRGASVGMNYFYYGDNLVNTSAVGGVFPYAAAPLLIHRVPTGTPTFLSAINSADLTFGVIDIPPQYLKGPHRVVGMAFEVVNTTEQLYRNGAVTCYRVPSRITDSVYSTNMVMPTGTPGFNADGTFQANSTAPQTVKSSLRTYGSIAPPTTPAQASLAHGSVSWDASEGAYVIPTFESIPEVQNQRAAMHYWYNADTDPATSTTAMGMGLGVRTDPSIPTGAPRQDVVVTGVSTNSANWNGGAPVTVTEGDPLQPGTSLIPIMRSGAYFTGLSNQTSLQLSVRFFIERIPPLSEPDIYTLANRSSPMALATWELYSQVVPEMPPGVMFTENPLGEWFNKVSGLVAKYAPKVGEMLSGAGVPYAGLIGRGIGKGADVLHHVNQAASGNQQSKEKLVKKEAKANAKATAKKVASKS